MPSVLEIPAVPSASVRGLAHTLRTGIPHLDRATWTPKLLDSIANAAESFYEPFDIPRPGKPPRHIDNPMGDLKMVQRAIYRTLLKETTKSLPLGMTGGIAGRSTADNAAPHLGQPLVGVLDIKDCFPHTRYTAIYSVWRERYGFEQHLATILTKLTTRHGHLPQGAPTSSALCNLALLPLYESIDVYAKLVELNFTLFVDDITISGKPARVRDAVGPIVKRIVEHGYAVRSQKVDLMGGHQRQSVTGWVVNEKTNVPRMRIMEVRDEIIRLGREPARVTSADLRSVSGKINNIRRVAPEKADGLEELAYARLPKVSSLNIAPRKAERQPCTCGL